MGQVIAIDGPAGAGKSTIARNLAAALGFTYVDTGAMYRTVALAATRARVPIDDGAKVSEIARAARIRLLPGRRVALGDEDVTDAIRDPEITSAASVVAALREVRAALVEQQKRMASTVDLVMEGRDIGSVVFPDAAVKIYLDADPEERARRRSAEMPAVDVGALTAQMRERDERDRNRAESPLVQAPDAVYLDSTGMTPEEVQEAILKVARQKLGKESGTKGIRAANAQG